ncbi:N-lysine methyltransferase KMT5A-B-like [Lineus longissimus]|uniref:N-lysine methyltransferase KMT5A-B-like n=1 Tax=Lineus longissimus TaxID=88925 RepID=UPI002B4D5594
MEEKTDAKITDFFPTSPNQTQTGSGEKNEIPPIPFLTPESTPTKNESSASTTNTIKTKKSKVIPKYTAKEIVIDATGDKPEPLADELLQTPPVGSTKKKRGRRRGKGKKSQAQTEETDEPTETRPTTAQRRRKPKKEEAPSHQLTEYFQVRRSDRRLKTDFEKQKKEMLEEAILSGSEDGLKVVDFEGKGRGVVSCKVFQRGDFVVEYRGNLIDLSKAKEKEAEYSQKPDIGCYMYYFNYNNKNYCVDATAESGKLGRLLNHSKSGNCKTKVVGIDNRPYLILVAARDISEGEELLYDYGDRSKEAIAAHPWLAK